MPSGIRLATVKTQGEARMSKPKKIKRSPETKSTAKPIK
jgi:hypothetical protein